MDNNYFGYKPRSFDDLISIKKTLIDNDYSIDDDFDKLSVSNIRVECNDVESTLKQLSKKHQGKRFKFYGIIIDRNLKDFCYTSTNYFNKEREGLKLIHTLSEFIKAIEDNGKII